MILDAIIEEKRREVAILRQRFQGKKIDKWLKDLPKPRPFLKSKRFKLIAEIKRASPSAGVINDRLNVASLAKAYEESGAAAVSVLTDEKYFHGQLSDLNAAKQSTTVPILRKDFIIDEVQVYESRLSGADAILLIVRILTDRQLAKLLKLAKKMKLAVLVEVHNAAEVRRALKAKAPIIGINNRDLDNLKINLQTTVKLMKQFPQLKRKPVISESGIRTRADIINLKTAGVKGVLIGEVLLKSGNPPAKISELLS
jgi:indole-3-glycerol phosphate synthase